MPTDPMLESFASQPDIFSRLQTPREGRYATGERGPNSNIRIIPLFTGPDAFDSLNSYYPMRLQDSVMGANRTKAANAVSTLAKPVIRSSRAAARAAPLTDLSLPGNPAPMAIPSFGPPSIRQRIADKLRPAGDWLGNTKNKVQDWHASQVNGPEVPGGIREGVSAMADSAKKNIRKALPIAGTTAAGVTAATTLPAAQDIAGRVGEWAGDKLTAVNTKGRGDQPGPVEQPAASGAAEAVAAAPGKAFDWLKNNWQLAGGVGLGGLLAYYLWKRQQKKRENEYELPMKFAAVDMEKAIDNEFVLGFLTCCARAGDTEPVVFEKIAEACNRNDAVRDEFEKCAWGAATGSPAGSVTGGMTGGKALQGLPIGPQLNKPIGEQASDMMELGKGAVKGGVGALAQAGGGLMQVPQLVQDHVVNPLMRSHVHPWAQPAGGVKIPGADAIASAGSDLAGGGQVLKDEAYGNFSSVLGKPYVDGAIRATGDIGRGVAHGAGGLVSEGVGGASQYAGSVLHGAGKAMDWLGGDGSAVKGWGDNAQNFAQDAVQFGDRHLGAAGADLENAVVQNNVIEGGRPNQQVTRDPRTGAVKTGPQTAPYSDGQVAPNLRATAQHEQQQALDSGRPGAAAVMSGVNAGLDTAGDNLPYAVADVAMGGLPSAMRIPAAIGRQATVGPAGTLPNAAIAGTVGAGMSSGSRMPITDLQPSPDKSHLSFDALGQPKPGESLTQLQGRIQSNFAGSQDPDVPRGMQNSMATAGGAAKREYDTLAANGGKPAIPPAQPAPTAQTSPTGQPAPTGGNAAGSLGKGIAAGALAIPGVSAINAATGGAIEQFLTSADPKMRADFKNKIGEVVGQSDKIMQAAPALAKGETPVPQNELDTAAAQAVQGATKGDPQSVWDTVGNMDPMQKFLLWGGLGLGAVGLISALSDEDGGIMPWLMSLLGLGGAAFAAGNAGLLGDGMKSLTSGLGDMAGTATGMKAPPQKLSPEVLKVINSLPEDQLPNALSSYAYGVKNPLGGVGLGGEWLAQPHPEAVTQLDRMTGGNNFGDSAMSWLGDVTGQTDRQLEAIGIDKSRKLPIQNAWLKARRPAA